MEEIIQVFANLALRLRVDVSFSLWKVEKKEEY